MQMVQYQKNTVGPYLSHGVLVQFCAILLGFHHQEWENGLLLIGSTGQRTTSSRNGWLAVQRWLATENGWAGGSHCETLDHGVLVLCHWSLASSWFLVGGAAPTGTPL